MAEDDGRKKPRSVMARDSDWRLIRTRVRKTGRSVSDFLIERGLAPSEPAAERAEVLPLAMQRRAAVDLRILVLAERMRFEDEGRAAAWQRLVEEAEASVADDGREG